MRQNKPMSSSGAPTARAFPRRVDLVGGAVLVLLVAIWAALRTGVARSVIGSPQALLVLTGVGLLAALIGVGVWRLTRRPLLARGLALVPVLAVFGWSEVLPMLSAPVVRADADPLVAVSTMSSPANAESSASTGSAVSAVAPSTAVPVLLGSAALVGIDHEAGGTVQLIRSVGGSLVIRFEDFFVEPGPDYLLYAVPGAGATSPAGGTSLGSFAVTGGSVNLDLPADVTGSGAVTVLIWCRTYAVPVAHATLLG